jgi:putative endonuclease
MGGFVYILVCRDGSYYVGCTSGSLEKRMAEHQAGTFDGYTAHRLPVSLVFQQSFELIDEAVAAERQIKGWRRAKKETLIRRDYPALPVLTSPAIRAKSGPA